MVVEIAPIFAASLEGFNAVLKKVFDNEKMPAVIVAANTAIRDVAKREGTPVFPSLATKLLSIEQNNETYNPKMLKIRGSNPVGEKQPYPTNEQIYIRAIPVKVTLQVYYLATDYKDIIRAIQMWMFNSVFANFTLSSEKYEIPVRVDLDKNISIPDEMMEGSSEIGDYYTLELTAYMQTYIGVQATKPTIHRITTRVPVVLSTTDPNLLPSEEIDTWSIDINFEDLG